MQAWTWIDEIEYDRCIFTHKKTLEEKHGRTNSKDEKKHNNANSKSLKKIKKFC